MSGPFRGFRIKMPVYTVVCPQTGLSFDVKSLTVAEVTKLRTSLTTPSKATFIINEMLWGALEIKPDFITSEEDFKKITTLRDREALMYGCYISTFGENREFTVSCTSCAYEQTTDVNLPSIFSMEVFPGSKGVKTDYLIAKSSGDTEVDKEVEKEIAKEEKSKAGKGRKKSKKESETLPSDAFVDDEDDDGIVIIKPGGENKSKLLLEDLKKSKEKSPESDEEKRSSSDRIPGEEDNETSILHKRERVTLPISKVVCVLKAPTIWDEENIMKNISFSGKKQTDTVNETLIIDRFEVFEPADKLPSQIIMDREDIIFGYNSLPPQYKIKIFDAFQNTFGKYGIELSTEFTCRQCGIENKLDIDITTQFFRMVAVTG